MRKKRDRNKKHRIPTKERKTHQPLLGDALSYNTENFNELVNTAQGMLKELENEVTNGSAILNPNTPKKQELVAQLTPIIDVIKSQWQLVKDAETESNNLNDPKESKRKRSLARKIKWKFTKAAKELKATITAVSKLNVSTEATVFKLEEKLNTETDEINVDMKELLANFEALKANTKVIARLEYGKTLSTYLIYTAAAAKATYTFIAAWIDSLTEATKAAGHIFYPISATFTTIVRLFAFGGRAIQTWIAYKEMSQQASELAQLEFENAKNLLRRSAAFKFVAFTLNFLSVLAFAGLLTTPLGWVFVAAATTIDWIDDGLESRSRAKEGLEKFLEVNKDADKESTAYQKAEKDKRDLVAQTDSTAKWGFGNVVAMILIACAPIPVVGPILSLAGLFIMGVVTVRNTYVAAKPYAIDAKNYFFPPKPAPNAIKKDIELDLYREYVPPTVQLSKEVTNASVQPDAEVSVAEQRDVKLLQDNSHTKIEDMPLPMVNVVKPAERLDDEPITHDMKSGVEPMVHDVKPAANLGQAKTLKQILIQKMKVEVKVVPNKEDKGEVKNEEKTRDTLVANPAKAKKSRFPHLFPSVETGSSKSKSESKNAGSKHSPQAQTVHPDGSTFKK